MAQFKLPERENRPIQTSLRATLLALMLSSTACTHAQSISSSINADMIARLNQSLQRHLPLAIHSPDIWQMIMMQMVQGQALHDTSEENESLVQVRSIYQASLRYAQDMNIAELQRSQTDTPTNNPLQQIYSRTVQQLTSTDRLEIIDTIKDLLANRSLAFEDAQNLLYVVMDILPPGPSEPPSNNWWQTAIHMENYGITRREYQDLVMSLEQLRYQSGFVGVIEPEELINQISHGVVTRASIMDLFYHAMSNIRPISTSSYVQSAFMINENRQEIRDANSYTNISNYTLVLKLARAIILERSR